MTSPTDSINDEYKAARTEAALRDASHWGRLWIRGADHLDFLHRMTTNSFNGLETGQGCEAVFVEQRARIIDLGVFYRGTESTLLLLNPQSREEIPIWLDRFIFAEAIEFEDVTDKTAMLECCGPHMAKLLQQTLSLDLDPHQDGHLIDVPTNDTLWLARTDWDGHPGLRAIGPPEAIADIREKLIAAGALQMTEATWEILRIEQGMPVIGRELTDSYNPWEAGLGRAIHMDKGCYIGQEVIARLDNYDKIKQHLVGLLLQENDLPTSDQALNDGQREVGHITSAVHSPALGPIALAYVRRNACAPGTMLASRGAQVTVVSLPFARAL